MKLAKEAQFKRDVKVLTPVDGGHREESVAVTYRVIGDAESKQLLGNGIEAGPFLKRAVVRIDGVVGDDDKPLPASDELRDQVLDAMPNARSAIAKAYWDAVGKVAQGN